MNVEPQESCAVHRHGHGSTSCDTQRSGGNYCSQKSASEVCNDRLCSAEQHEGRKIPKKPQAPATSHDLLPK